MHAQLTSQIKTAHSLRSVMALTIFIFQSPMAVYCVLGGKFRAVFGRQGPAIQNELPPGKQAFGSGAPAQVPEGGCVCTWKKTLEGKWTDGVCVYVCVFLHLSINMCTYTPDR